jgi:adenylate kinase
VARGRLVPDAVVGAALAARVDMDDARTAGFVLDGYPRTIAQAIALERMLAPDQITVALELMVPEREAAHRLLSRFVCTGCGQPATTRPGRAGEGTDACARCGSELRRRADDDVSVIRHRFREFEECTKPLLEWLDRRRLLVTVDADRPADEVAHAVLHALVPVLERAGLAALEPGLTA